MSKRTFTTAEKLEMVNEAMHSGSSIKFVAAKYQLKESQLYDWRKQLLGSQRAEPEGSKEIFDDSYVESRTIYRTRVVDKCVKRNQRNTRHQSYISML